MLNSAADTEGKKNFGFDVLACLSYQRSVICPSGIDNRSCSTDTAPQQFGQFVQLFKIIFVAHAPAAANYYCGVFYGVLSFRRAFILHQTNTWLRQVILQWQAFDHSPPFVIMRYFLESTRSNW